MTTEERLHRLADASQFFAPFTGDFDLDSLRACFKREVGTPAPSTRIILPKSLVHIISGNTPHAAYQTLLNGLILGAHNRLKLPSQALLDFAIPKGLEDFIEISRELPDHWLPEADALVVYGSDATLRHFQQLCPLETPFIGHGHRIGIAIIDDPTPEAARLAARDIGRYDQQGCLSLQTIYLKDPHSFAPLLAEAMADFEQTEPRAPLAPSEAGSITNFREEMRYLSAQTPDAISLWESPGSTAWTIVASHSPDLTLSPGNRSVLLRPIPEDFSNLSHLSGIGLHPFTPRTDLPSPRLFPLGRAQSPPALWAHDGICPLASLVKRQTLA